MKFKQGLTTWKKRKKKIWLEREIGITGGKEDGIDNTGVKHEILYIKPEQVYNVYENLAAIDPMFSRAVAFGNIHGVYKPGNVVLSRRLLDGHQKYIKEQIKSDNDKPAFLVMHGGSSSTKEEIAEAVNNGVVKMNVDTDTQWAYWEGLENFCEKNKGYLQGQANTTPAEPSVPGYPQDGIVLQPPDLQALGAENESCGFIPETPIIPQRGE